jgi:subtilisin-like proprotein convertase family protein
MKGHDKELLSARAAFAGQAVTGTWRQRVSDGAAQDVGKLNSWRLLIKAADGLRRGRAAQAQR